MLSSHFSALCFCWVWEEMAACAWQRRPQQILLVRSVICRAFVFLAEKCCNILICSRNTMNNRQTQNNYTLINAFELILALTQQWYKREMPWLYLFHHKMFISVHHSDNFSQMRFLSSDSHCSNITCFW